MVLPAIPIALVVLFSLFGTGLVTLLITNLFPLLGMLLIGLILIVGYTDINGDQNVFKKVPLETFESWDCDLQLRYLGSTLPPETHRLSYIKNCVEDNDEP